MGERDLQFYEDEQKKNITIENSLETKEKNVVDQLSVLNPRLKVEGSIYFQHYGSRWKYIYF